MNSISTPDLNNLTDKQRKEINQTNRGGGMDDFSAKPKVDFATATQHRDIAFTGHDPTLDLPPDGNQLYEEFTKTKRGQQTAVNMLDRGVKINGTYVARRRILTAIIAAVIVLLTVIFFAPPIFSSNSEESSCRSEDIFARKGVAQYKSEMISNCNVYNINAMTSDLSKSYRICTVSFDVKNYTPFPIVLDDYAIANGGEHKDHIVYSDAVDNEPVKISGFSSRTVKVEILINKEGLTDEEFDKAITSLVLSTKGMKRELFGKVKIPSIPGLMFVSDVITFEP